MIIIDTVLDPDVALERFVRRVEVQLAGLEARAYVRGAMDPAYEDERVRDLYARLLAVQIGPRVAAAFLTGWAVHRNNQTSTAPETRIHHRAYGDVLVEVNAA